MLHKFGWIIAVLSLVIAGAAVARNTQQTIKEREYTQTKWEAKTAYAEGDWVGAENHYREMIKKHPKDAQAWFMLGYSVHYQGRYDEARELFLDSEELGSNRGLVHYNLACGYAQQGNQEKALEELEFSAKVGFNQPEWAEEDPDLVSLRSNEKFQKIVNKMREE
ncbi:MAG: tetratricopeptide repeat protein [Fimbriimonadaceae bacterium]|nr:MAG: tetratricopeptide repeat protein [Fimbriimonadaceae bacterium]